MGAKCVSQVWVYFPGFFPHTWLRSGSRPEKVPSVQLKLAVLSVLHPWANLFERRHLQAHCEPRLALEPQGISSRHEEIPPRDTAPIEG